MTTPDPAPLPPPLPRPLSGRLGGCAVVILVLIGLVLLLPGLCSIVLMGLSLQGSSGGQLGNYFTFFFTTFLVAAGGVALIVYAVRNR